MRRSHEYSHLRKMKDEYLLRKLVEEDEAAAVLLAQQEHYTQAAFLQVRAMKHYLIHAIWQVAMKEGDGSMLFHMDEVIWGSYSFYELLNILRCKEELHKKEFFGATSRKHKSYKGKPKHTLDILYKRLNNLYSSIWEQKYENMGVFAVNAAEYEALTKDITALKSRIDDTVKEWPKTHI